MGDSAISWTTKTWNPLVGCAWISEECDECYAARDTAGRLSHLPLYAGLAVRPDDGGPAKFTGEIRLAEDRLDQPTRWSKPCRIFVNSMSDLFHRDVPHDFIDRVFDVMEANPRHQFQVLTKRPQLMQRYLSGRDATPDEVDDGCELGFVPGRWYDNNGGRGVPEHIWCGTSIGLDKYVRRANNIRGVPAKVRFISAEPLIGPLPSLDLSGIDWLIIGGESSNAPSRARKMETEWCLDLIDRCRDYGVAVFMKQLGNGLAAELGCRGKGADPSEWPAALRVQEYPVALKVV